MSNELKHDSSNGTLSILRYSGSFKDYLKGLDLIRQSITNQEQELKRALTEFYKANDVDEKSYNLYLKSMNNFFGSIKENSQLTLMTIDSENSLLKVINEFAKSINRTEKMDCLLIIENLTDFHENLKYSQEILQIIMDNFEKESLVKLRKLSIDDFYNLEYSSKSSDYKVKIESYSSEIDRIINQFRLLIISSKTKMDLNLLTKSTLVDRLTENCDTERFPLLLMLPDLNAKLEETFRLGKLWLDREEVFLYQIREEIRQLRVLTKEKSSKIENEKQNHSRLLKEMKTSNLMVQNNKQKMSEVRRNLNELNEQILFSKSEYEKKVNQKQHSKSMVEFLEISISQTKRNYSLQFKRQKLQREITELENSLKIIQENIVQMTSKTNTISQTAEFIEMKSKNDEKDFIKIKLDLEMYSQNVFSLKKELEDLKKILNTFQSIEILRTSPEYVDNIFDQHSSEYVKLAPSLLKKIDMKKQMLS